MVLLFFALDYGVDFVDTVTPYNLLGLSASLSFVSFYYLGSKLVKRYSLLFGLLSGLSAYVIMAYLLSYISVSNGFIPALILLALIVLTTIWFQEIPEVVSRKSGKLKSSQMLGRGLFATSFVLILSFVPELFDAKMSGIFSSFPSSLLPLLLILHVSQGKEVVHSVIKFLPMGYIGVMIYSIVVGKLYVGFGIGLGTVMALSISIGYLILVLVLQFGLGSLKIRRV